MSFVAQLLPDLSYVRVRLFLLIVTMYRLLKVIGFSCTVGTYKFQLMSKLNLCRVAKKIIFCSVHLIFIVFVLKQRFLLLIEIFLWWLMLTLMMVVMVKNDSDSYDDSTDNVWNTIFLVAGTKKWQTQVWLNDMLLYAWVQHANLWAAFILTENFCHLNVTFQT